MQTWMNRIDRIFSLAVLGYCLKETPFNTGEKILYILFIHV